MTTISEVAKRAGVSKTTVSHVLSGKRPVNPDTRESVEAAIAELGFRPNGLARSLRTRRSHTVALLIPDITNPYYPVLARGLQDSLVASGYHAFLCNTDADRSQELEFLDDVAQRRVDGIAMVPFQISTDDLEDVVEASIPIVSISPHIEHPQADQVTTDDVEGATDATLYLVARGHSTVAMIGGPPGLPPSDRRLAGYRRALERSGRPFDDRFLAEGDFTRRGGRRAMQTLMRLEPRPTAVLCANDLMAIGAMDSARELGCSIPDDMALVGYDDIEAAALVTPALTTVLNPAYEMGHAAGRLLLERMADGYSGRPRRVVIPHRLIERESA
jgi:LacI family transcriptional regulator